MAVFFTGVGCGGVKASRTMRIGYQRDDLHQLAYYVAVQKGFFRDAGLEVREVGPFNSGTEEMSAFSAGQLDMGYVGVSSAVMFAVVGMADVEVVALVNREGSAVVVAQSFEGADASSLRGRRVAIPGFSTIQHLLLLKALSAAGLGRDDVDIVSMNPEDMEPALLSGAIDAFVAREPYPYSVVGSGSGRILIESGSIWPNHPCCAVVAERGFARRRPDVVRRAVKAHVRATRYILENPDEATDMGHLFTGLDRGVVDSAMSNIEFAFTPGMASFEEYVEFLGGQGVVDVEDPERTARMLLDDSYLPRR